MNVVPMHRQEAVTGFVLKDKASEKKRIMRWHVMAGLCLLHGFRKGAELGVSQGRFTMYLCATMHNMEMLAVDLWQERPDNTVEGGQTYEGWDHQGNYERFKANCEEYFPGRVTIVRSDTVAAAAGVEDGSLDFVFIDGDHSYDGCTRDIQAWYPKVRNGGIVAGHDFHWPTVAQAVKDWGKKVAIAHDHVWVHFKNA